MRTARNSMTSRWDLTYYVGARSGRDRARQELLDTTRRPHRASQSPATIAVWNFRERRTAALSPCARTPRRWAASPLDLASKRTHRAFGGRDRARARSAISSYLDGFEPVEPALSVVDAALRKDIEADYIRYREALREGRPLTEVSALQHSVEDGLAQAEQRLAGKGLGPMAVFTGALTILAREGLEAVLLVVAILGVLARSGRRDAMRFVHAGWIAALARATCGGLALV
jgi:high-affinity iron transporter